MVMKFVNDTLVLAAKKAVVALSIIGLTACASNMTLPAVGEKAQLKETTRYLPKQAYSEQGAFIKYEEKENPYLAVKSRIAKGSVLLYIEAKKAKRQGDLKTAKKKLMVITQNDDSISGPWVMLGHIAFEEKKYPQAEKHYQQAININPKNINAYVAQAQVQRVMGAYHVAQNTLARALNLWPDFPEAHLNLGILYDLYLNQSEKSQQHLEAYLFLTHYKNKKAINWYSEVQGRTGINKSFIDEKISTLNPLEQLDRHQQAIAEHIVEDQ
jgi:tetratricopeptide (TPR) repeat protein